MSEVKMPPAGDAPQQSGGSLMTPEQMKQSKATALVAQFKEIDKKAEGWIQSWNPYIRMWYAIVPCSRCKSKSLTFGKKLPNTF
jgi:hypothetical protein